MNKINEGRKPIPRSLPPLAEVCQNFTGFAKGEHRSDRVYKILLALIQRYRQGVPRPFYAMREVAAFFKVSLTSAYLIYQRLHREGAVTLMRSSQTMIVPRS